LDYLEESLREQAYQKVNRVGEPRSGKIDYDILGRLSGNWFYEEADPGEQSSQLAFVYYVYNASQIVVSIGGEYLHPLKVGLYFATGPDFGEVSAESGAVTYHLVGSDNNYTLIVQVVGDEKIKVEAFEGHQNGLSFTDKAKANFYTRTGSYRPTSENSPSEEYCYLTSFLLGYYYYSQQQTKTFYIAACGTAAILIVATITSFKLRRK